MSSYIYNDALESERLTTRFLTEDDISAWTSFCSDEESMEFFPELKLKTPQESAEFWIGLQLNRYAENRYGLQALIHKQTGEFIGQCGLLSQVVGEQKELEVGYHVFRKYWGQGYAPEAARMFIDFAFQNNQATSVISIIDVPNSKSQKVAEKNNLVREKRMIWSELDVFIYRIEKNQFNNH